MANVRMTTRPCPDCDSTEELVMPLTEWENLKANRMAIQYAAPSLTAAQRERFLTGLCGDCYTKMCEGLDDGH